MGAVQVLVVAGGGGGGNNLSGGGGGAGGVVYNSAFSIGIQSYSVTVGGGGGAQANGGNSVFSSITAIGGGAGGGGGVWNAGVAGATGGSGGGGSGDYSVARAGGSGTAGQGNAGGASTTYSNGAYKGGGGGGAGAVGTAASTTSAGNGGVGVAYSISGSSVYYGGGGGGSVYRESGTNTIGTGGTGGGGNGENHLNGSGIVTAATAGTANTGGGGGGSAEATGAAGGSGIVIIRYLTGSVTATGGTVTTSGGDTIHTFTSSGTFNVTAATVTTSDAVAMKQRPLLQTKFIDDPNLIAYWPLDGNSNDTKGGFNGTDTSVSYTTGKFGSAASYNGSTSVTSITGMNTQLSRDSTFSCWINITSFGVSGTAGVFMESDVASYSNYFKAMYTYNSAGTMSIQFAKYDGAANPGTSVGSVTTGQWYYLCGVQRGTTLELYLNGNLVSTATDSTTTVPGYSNFKLGAQTSQAGRYFTGLIEDAAVFNRALGREEIAEIYQGFIQSESLPTIRPVGGLYSTSLINDASLVAYWKLDGNSRDSKGSYHGTDSAVTYNSASGRFGQGGVFNGSSSYTNFGDVLDVGTGNFSVGAWFKSSAPTTAFVIAKSSARGFFGRWGFYADPPSTTIRFLMEASGSVTYDIGANYTGFFDNNWHLAAATIDRTGLMTLYLDGVPVASTSVAAASGQNINGTDPLYIGAYGNGTGTAPGYFYNGSIDDVFIFTRLLSSTEVSSIFEAGAQYSVRPLSSIPSMVNDPNLVSYWKLDGNALDYKGVNSGTAVSMTYSTSPSGLFNQGGLFNGTSGYIYGNNTNIPSSGNITVSCWIRPERNAGQYQDIVASRSDGNYNWILYQHTTDGAISFHGAAQNKTTIVPTLNTWIHVVATVAVGVQCIYINGRLTYTTSGYTYGGTSANKLSIGGFNNGGVINEPFKGAIDDVAVFNRALSSEEVSLLYSGSRIVGYWKLNGNSTDYSGNGNHGTDTSVTYPSTGRYGLCGNFTGSSLVNAGNGASVQLTGALTVSCWIKTTQSLAYRGMVSKMSTGSPNYSWLLRMYASSIPCAEFGVSSTGSDYTNIVGTTNINDGKWHYIVGVFDPGAFLKIYVDGNLQGTNTTSIPTKMFNTAGPVIIGASYSNLNEPTIGLIEEVIIEDTVRTAADIKKYYTKTTGRFGII